jgi:hypothetical protein
MQCKTQFWDFFVAKVTAYVYVNTRVWNTQAAGDDEGLEEFCSAENSYAQRLAGGLGTLQQLNQEMGKTIVMVTHDPEAARFAKRTLHLDKGVFAEVTQ